MRRHGFRTNLTSLGILSKIYALNYLNPLKLCVLLRLTMRILYVSQFFPPEVGAAANRARNFVKFWSKEGAEVTVIAEIPNYPSGRIPNKYLPQRVFRENADDKVEVLRVPVLPSPSGGTILRKIVNNFSFYMNGRTAVSKLLNGKFDIIFATAPPFFSTPLGYTLARRYTAPLVLDIRDVWPELLLTQEGCNKLCEMLVNILAKFMKLYYCYAELIVSPVPYILQYLKKYPISSTYWTPNGVDFQEIDKIKPANIRKNRFTAIYAGILGRNHGTGTLLKVIEKVRDVEFWVIGDGKDRPLFEHSNLPNLKYLGIKSWEETISYIKAADVGIVMLRDNVWMRNAFPVKAIDYLAVGKPVLISIRSVFAELLRENEAGLSAESNDVEQFISNLRLLKDNELLRKKMSKNARKLAEKHFDMSFNASQLLKKLEEIVEKSKRSGRRSSS